MRKPQGYATEVSPAGSRELDTFTCSHCQRIVPVKPLAAPEDFGGLCKVCMKLICPGCVKLGSCLTWEAKMEKMEATERFLRSAGI
jgi:hypothetical protein